MLVTNCYYYIIDDTDADDINAALETINSRIENISQRVDKLGFKSGIFEVSGIDASLVTTNEIKKQGNYVIANLSIVTINQNVDNLEIIIPQEFRPKEEMKLYVCCDTALGKFYTHVITTDGFEVKHLDYTNLLGVHIYNIGWEIGG